MPQTKKTVLENDRFKHVSHKTARFINAVTKSGLVFDEEKEDVDMCVAIQELIKEGQQELRIQLEANKAKLEKKDAELEKKDAELERKDAEIARLKAALEQARK